MNSLGRALTLLLLLAILGACSTTPLPIREYEPSRDVRVVSYNVHFADAREGFSRVRDHARATASVLRELEPDLACLQEVSTTEFPYVVPDNPFRRMLAEELRSYGWIGPHGASEMAGSSPILYRTSRYLPIRQGIHWFSETPTVPDSAHWGNHLPRHVTWTLLFDARAGQHLFVANTHLDPWSRRANRRAIAALEIVIRREARRSPDDPFGSVPIVLCGDFNEPRTSPLRIPLEGLLDSVFSVTDGPTMQGAAPLQIDGIYASEDLTVLASSIRRGHEPSDHYPLVADLRLPRPMDHRNPPAGRRSTPSEGAQD